ncbi:hypothetical protein GCM10009548_92330 [Streptomyces malaysiensis subsp. malaysiensis]
MHRAVLQQGQDRGAHIAAPRPPAHPATGSAAATAAERGATEGRTVETGAERAEGRTPPLAFTPAAVAGSAVLSSMSM